MSDACGCGHDEPRVEGEEDHEPDKWWQVTEIRAAAVAGLLLVAALVVGWTDGPHPVKLTLEALALIVAGYTFVPSTLTRLARGKIGVGTLMTIAAVGAVLLGEVGLAGEVRRVVGAGRRLAEANRLGFDRGVVPRDVEGVPKGMKKFEVSNVAQALSTLTR